MDFGDSGGRDETVRLDRCPMVTFSEISGGSDGTNKGVDPRNFVGGIPECLPLHGHGQCFVELVYHPAARGMHGEGAGAGGEVLAVAAVLQLVLDLGRQDRVVVLRYTLLAALLGCVGHQREPGIMAHACNPSTSGGRGRQIMSSADWYHPGQCGQTLSLLKIQKLAGLECNDAISAHCNLYLQSSSNSPASAFQWKQVFTMLARLVSNSQSQVIHPSRPPKVGIALKESKWQMSYVCSHELVPLLLGRLEEKSALHMITVLLNLNLLQDWYKGDVTSTGLLSLPTDISQMLRTDSTGMNFNRRNIPGFRSIT
ncbi:hypothetical protein AAY473_006534 [Plecturocebus cupreus]